MPTDHQLSLFGDVTTEMGTRKRPTADVEQAPRPRRRGGGGENGAPPAPPGSGNGSSSGGDLDASLIAETRRRYLNYALSVITARALPDVRDGLKPVQRRILYAMLHDEHLHPDAKHRKSAKVVGSVIGRYHPHGDVAVYDAMVRMAQDFSLRLPLVDGSGNFGSLDGDPPAAYRYTECRLAPPAPELLRELAQDTVAFRPTYDATTTEPTVLPARFPNLLVNGSTGIAVGMATNIPPHNLGEVTRALIALVEDRSLSVAALLRFIKGPDFPTGGIMLASKAELRQVYETGQGAIRVRGEHKLEPQGRGSPHIVITSIPYGVTKSTVVERIADVIIARKLPQLVDVRDESTTDVRIVLETRPGASPDMVMAYLFKHTPLQQSFNVNLTCLVPEPGSDACRPARLGLKELLLEFLDFRFEVTRRRFEHDLRALKKRIHILEGFETVFDALDETIRIIRKSEGKKDAAQKLCKRFDLDDVQVDAILELKLYKLARLEILVIREELAEKRAEASRIEAILRSKAKLWGVIKSELSEVADAHGDRRRTKTGGAAEDLEREYDADAYIVAEDAHVVVTRDGWLKRVGKLRDPNQTRVREGDQVMAVLPGSTRENVVFFTNYGSAYVIKINDVPPSSGYGDPAQKLFKFKDGERVITAMTLDPRALVPDTLVAISARGFGLRFASEPHSQVSTRTGRRYAKPQKGDEIVDVRGAGEGDMIVVATRKGHALVCAASEINKLENPGKGVTVIKTGANDAVIGFIVASHSRHVLAVKTSSGRAINIPGDPKKAVARGGKGHQVVKRSELSLAEVPVHIVALATAEGSETPN
ncbi:MAG TPA: DNA topoisomerase IV subunit A [Kofleriaceae bacterium]|nr:DNA topoisomerase IV subunit A [Kofleriaceae bacterium]